MAVSIQNKFDKICEFVSSNPDKFNENDLETICNHFELTQLEAMDIGRQASQAIAHAVRFDLDFGGQSKTAKKLDIIAQELASEGWIQEPTSTIDLEEELLKVYELNQNIKKQKQNGIDFINKFYLENVQKPKKISQRFIRFIFVLIYKILSFKNKFKNFKANLNVFVVDCFFEIKLFFLAFKCFLNKFFDSC
jgi:hypothetical protein